MAEYVLSIDYDKCTGCRMCELVCSLSNSGEVNPVKSRIRIIKIHSTENMIPIPVVCMHCEKPPCSLVCPRSAISTHSETKARQIDKTKCIGCSSCVYACPFGAMAVDREEGCSFVCSLCDGTPECAQFCPTGAIQFLDNDEIAMQRGRNRIRKYLDFIGCK